MAIQDYNGQQNLSDVSGLTEGQGSNWNPASSTLSTGDLRRRYNFSDSFTELSIDQTPFFRLVSQIGKSPTDDPQFKYSEKRQSWFRRYAYVVGYKEGSNVVVDDATLQDTSGADIATTSVGGTFDLYMGTDYANNGNMFNVIGQTGKKVGASGTKPQFFLKKQIIKVNLSDTAGGGGGADIDDYALFQVSAVNTSPETVDLSAQGGASDADVVKLTCKCVKAPSSDDYKELASFDTNAALVGASLVPTDSGHGNSTTIAGTLEPRRSYVTGTSYEEGSTLIQQNWMDQPYSTGYGYTQIFRNEFGMTNTMRATALKYEPNEWMRVWRDKLIEHKWEIEQTALFGSQGTYTGADGGTYQVTQGAADYVANNGNIFVLDTATKHTDDFLEDLSMLVDPRYNNSKDMVFFCDTATYNWMHKLGGYFSNNLGINQNSFRYDFAAKGGGKMFGVDFTTISTIYGDIRVVRNIHLDGSNIKIMGVNMRYVKWRPLVGNGINRDTSVYVGVQTLENTGTDKRVDMILTEGGFEWSMPECHALWK
tara:strand:- start:14505 stop:16118 length:1614 start_codon:yes stop_codon:yes gene_type:complete